MPESRTRRAAAKDKEEGKSPSTQAGEYVREEIKHVREGKHGARSTEQAIAIGLSKARRDGVPVPAGKNASTSAKKKATQDEAASYKDPKPAAKPSKASSKALTKEGHKSVSKSALSSHTGQSASKHSASSRSTAAKAAESNGAAARSEAAKKATHTRSRKS